jgi:hypothetical protein
LDVLTTLLYFAHRGPEANPLVNLLMHFTGSPIMGLVVTKLLAVGIAVYCWRRSREKLLWGVNLFYSSVVVWNLVMLLVNHPR